MQNILSTIKEHTSSNSKVDKQALRLLHDIVVPLSEVNSDFPEKVLNYILTANNAYILQELQDLPDDKAGCLINFPGTYSYYCGSAQYDFPTKIEQLVAQSGHARQKLYHRLFNTFTPAQIIRYSKFLVATTRKDNFTLLSPLIPDWLTYLVIDALITTINKPPSSSKNNTNRDNWSLEAIETVLKADESLPDLAHKVIIHLMFERTEVEDYYTDSLNEIYKLKDSATYIARHQDYLQQIIPTLSAKGQRQFIKDFADLYPDVIKQMPKLVVQLSASDSKVVRQIAQAKLSLFEPASLLPHLKHLLQQGNAKQRRAIADVIVNESVRIENNIDNQADKNTLSMSHQQLLEEALETEKQKSVITVIQSALSRLDSVEGLQDQQDGFEIAPFEPLKSQQIPEHFIEVLNQNLDILLEKTRLLVKQENAEEKAQFCGYDWRLEQYKGWKKAASKNYPKSIMNALNASDGAALDILGNRFALELCDYKNSLKHLPEYGVHHAIKLSQQQGYFNWYRFNDCLTAKLLANIELRQLAQALTDCGIEDSNRLIAEQYLENIPDSILPQAISAPEQIVPFFMTHMDFLSEALGLLPSKRDWHPLEPSAAIGILAKFPQLPKPFIPKLLQMALGENKRLRYDAQQLLSNLPNIHERAIDALDDGKQAIRVTSVEWLVRLNVQKDSHRQQILTALYALLKKEKKEVVIASLLTALEQMGENISSYLSPESLLKEAETGLKAKTLTRFEWFNLDNLPAVQWKNGETVNPKIIQWWVTLAERLKDPMPNGLLQRYMDLLDKKSQQKLSLHLLQAFIAEDTRGPSIEEAMAIAKAEAPGQLEAYQDYYNNFGNKDPDSWVYRYATMTLDEMIEHVKKQHLATYLGSAIKSKGMLALTFAADGSSAVSALQKFMKHHYQRSAQVTAMLTALSASDDPLIIQLLLAISRRYRTRSVQESAKQLVIQIAERNDWTADELADRTIPTAGLDDDGILTLDYGTRTLTALVDNADKLVLQNEAGRVIKSLPAPRQNDDKAMIKEAKAQFNSSKKELKQVLTLQTARLYEAMCSERLWDSHDWQYYLFAHPIIKRLITRLVWLEVMIDAEGNETIITSFRPSDDGVLLGFDDKEISLQSSSFIKLAHLVLISEEQTQQWKQHLQYHDIRPLFSQFGHPLPSFNNHADCIDAFKGYVTDTYTLRGVLTKMGYQRASVEDARSFDHYFKAYDSLGLSAVITFSGSYVPEENIPAVLFELCFEKKQSCTWNTRHIALNEVKPILLAEAYAEYKKVAEASEGFDPKWQKKTPW